MATIPLDLLVYRFWDNETESQEVDVATDSPIGALFHNNPLLAVVDLSYNDSIRTYTRRKEDTDEHDSGHEQRGAARVAGPVPDPADLGPVEAGTQGNRDQDSGDRDDARRKERRR